MKKITIALVFASLIFASTKSFSQIFLEIEGVKGESSEKSHQNETEIGSFQFGMGTTTAQSTGSTRVLSGKPNISEVTITKTRGVISSLLQTALLTGKKYNKITLRFYNPSDKNANPIPYLVITYEDVLITGFSISSSGEKPAESISFNAIKFKTEDLTSSKDNPQPTKNISGWDQSKGQIYN